MPTPMDRAAEITQRFRGLLIHDGSTQDFNSCQEQIATAIREAVLEERQACARLVYPKSRLIPEFDVLANLADAIRAR